MDIREINEYLTKVVDGGETKRSWKYVSDFKCYKFPSVNFFSHKGFFKLWKWSQEQEWWCDFIDEFESDTTEKWKCTWWSKNSIIDPKKFAITVYEFLNANR